MVESNAQLQEKMAFFWHGHFATRVVNAKYNEILLNLIREKSLGNFGELLVAVSKSAAMLSFLNNQQNKKGHPNENFAREVMELFTLGRGNYTETDIRESARAFAGWAYDKEGNFIFRKNQHDTGSKTFLGRTGNFTGDDILQILLEQKATAQYITGKVYRFFVNEKLDETAVRQLSEKFYASNYDIKGLLKNIFRSAEFTAKENIGNKIKSPVELLAGIRRTLPIHFEKKDVQITYQRLLGQMLLYPPNVAGWPGGTSWIDSSTLLLRMKLPQMLTGIRPLDYTPKEDDDVNMGQINEKQQTSKKKLVATVNWDLLPQFSADDWQQFLLQTSSNNTAMPVQTASVKEMIIGVMSTPEYQLM